MARLLIVDDEADVLQLLNKLFSGLGYDVVVTQDGNEAIDLLREETSFDLMISDVRMLPVNGLWLLSLVREECPEMPVIMVTAYYSKDKAEQALKMGAHSYIQKPFDIAALTSAVTDALAKRADLDT